MTQQSKIDVSKWQASRRQFLYTPTLWFFYRMVQVAFLDARGTGLRLPTDEALLARDWIARSESPKCTAGNTPREFVSFPECCEMLGLNPDAERVGLLELIDSHTDCDNDESWARLEELHMSDISAYSEPLFDAPRVVPAVDQISLFA